MSFKSKIDFCGLADGTNILLKSHDEGRANSSVTCENDEGDTIDATVFGHVMDPSNEYALKGDLTNLSIVLGGVNTVAVGETTKHFMLKSVSIETSNSGEVTISASSEEVPSATPTRTYTVVIPSLRQRNKAQILNSLFSITGQNVHLQSASYTFEVESTITTVDGERVTWDCYGGKITASLEVKEASGSMPTIEGGDSTTYVTILSGEPTETRPDSDYATVSAEVTRYLTADAPSQNNG